MEWQGNRESENIEDRRGGGGRKFAIGGVGTIILAAVVFLMGGNPMEVLNLSSGQATSDYAAQPSEQSEIEKKFVSVALASTEDVWTAEFQKMGMNYEKPVMVLFSGQTSSECGGASAATGPFYCPADKKVYLDYSFFDELKNRFGVDGDFASYYVIAHEVGHHVQDILGITGKVQTMQRRTNEVEANKLSVRLELQADFLAGYWAKRSAQQFNLTEQDIRSALTAANAIGDDKLQKQSQGYVVPDAFTHGTSEQRVEWFMRGFQAQSIDEGNTFEALGSR